MDFAQQAVTTRDRGRAQKLFRTAFERERDAAESLGSDFSQEPTRAILFRSAATLALDCGDTAEAMRLATKGLTGNPPEDIKGELLQILKRCNAARVTK
jgi:hypothetical protein